MRWVFFSKSPKETGCFAKKVLNSLASGTLKNGALVIALEGDLGAGKTTFTKALAKALGIKESVLSPTFVLMKVYAVPMKYSSSLSRRFLKEGSSFDYAQDKLGSNNKITARKHLIHIDCYRLDSPEDLIHLGFKNIINDNDAIVLIEWANRVRKLLPKGALWIQFRHGKKQNERTIILQ